MAYVIAEPCIGTKDTACVDACPVDCIHPRKTKTISPRKLNCTLTRSSVSIVGLVCRSALFPRSSPSMICRRNGNSTPKSMRSTTTADRGVRDKKGVLQ
jgi:NAD-dependent dihydropyrimidine dehydrogenase PreA subunit